MSTKINCLVFMVLFLNQILLAQAQEDCSRVYLPQNYFDTTGDAMVTWDQGNTNICYAYTAIQMVDYFWKTSGTNFERIGWSGWPSLDPLYAAYITKKNRFLTRTIGSLFSQSGTALDFGVTSDVLKTIKEKGMCRKDVIKQSFKNYGQSLGIGMNKEWVITAFLHYFYADFFEAKNDLKWYQTWNAQRSKEFKDEHLKRLCSDPDWKANCKDFEILLDKLLPQFEKGKYMAVYDEMFKLCNNPNAIYKPSIRLPDVEKNHYLVVKKPAEVRKRIIDLLNRRNPTPVGIGYCSELLNNSNHNAKPCSMHISMIIGKKIKNGRCHFFLKNTWGEECSPDFDKKWECEYKLERTKRLGGHRTFGLWIDADDFVRNIFATYHFKY
jgi:hypothetical protein